jgi:integrase
MARRLNTMLAEMRFRRNLGTSRQDALKALFKAEIDRMNEMMDDLVTASKATGTGHKAYHLEADLMTGWAFRLLEVFGTATDLTFEADCPGRQHLLQSGVPEDFIPVIAETFRQERQFARTLLFEKPLKDEMNEVGLDVTRLNLERARTEVFRAKADVLLNTQSLYPQAERLQPETVARDPIPCDEPHSLEPVLEVVPVHVPAPQEALPSALESGTVEPKTIEHGETVADESPANLPVTDFLDKFNILLRNKAKKWRPETASNVGVVGRMFIDILVENGVEHSGQIRQAHLAALRDYFSLVPTNYGQSSRLRAMSVPELRALGQKMLEEADDDSTAKVGLAAQTIRKHLGNLQTFRDFLAARGHSIVQFEMKGLRPSKQRASELASLTPKPGPDKTEAMLRMPIFSGCASEVEMDPSGVETIHNSLYFLPMILVYLGMRRAEAAGLMVDDVVETASGWAMDIRSNEIRGLKTPQSARMLPVAPEVVRLGFLDYVGKLRSLGYRPLFPELCNPFDRKNADPGDRFYKNFIPQFIANAANGGPQWIRVLHALRHGHADTLKQNGVSPELIEDIHGRDGASQTTLRYTNPAGLPLLKDLLSRYPVVTRHLDPRPIRLLSFVEAKEPAPWFEDPDGKRGLRGKQR